MQQSRNALAAGPDPVLDRPLSTRSVIASLLLGRRPPAAPGRDLVRWCGLFGIAPGTVRVALHRMTAAGELDRDPRGYALAGPLARRQEEQQASLRPATRRWDGTWRLAIAGGHDARPAPVRADMRVALRRARMAEWREGVWIRPANIDVVEDPRCAWLDARPEGDPVALAHRLFEPDRWSRTATALIERVGEATAALDHATPGVIVPAFLAGAAALRHVRADPQLPAALLPGGWPGVELRHVYADYEHRFHTVARAFFRSA